MKRFVLTIATVAVALPVGAQAPDTTRVPLDAIVAVVGTVAITRYDIEQHVADSVRIMRGNKLPMPSEERRKEIILSTLKTLVDEELLLAKAKEMKIEVSDADVTNYTE